ncbi:hypothetical protein N7519_005484 [Penicillium mononematosum]|uniref:uncharacterized protein n=1 Tax=Penicillium mononematosum TaxID=268346 RepID=UPI002547BC59|nr:uncharacterized protein N7519_005484 [Penicillium mononematosum]KAJ6184183.1 hypothetical protein N7519_005484 [Penicillium mononematosum]
MWLCRISGSPESPSMLDSTKFRDSPSIFAFLLLLCRLCTWRRHSSSLCNAFLSLLCGVAQRVDAWAQVVFIPTSVLTLICDSLVLLLPMNIVFSLQAKLARKLALALVLFYLSLSQSRSVNSQSIERPFALQHPDDATWYFSVVMVWSTTEISNAIIALSLPALRALFAVWSKNRSTMHHSEIDNTGTIGLESIHPSLKQPIFVEHDIQETINVDWTNPSQETLWGVKDGNVRFRDMVRVGFERSRSR